MYFFILINFLTNLILVLFNPIKSSVTSTWPSQWTDDPIPIVGIFKDWVIFFVVAAFTHSKTIANTPLLWSRRASLINCFVSLVDLPFYLNFPLVDWGRRPKWPITVILFLIKYLTCSIIFFPPSNLTASHLVSLIIFCAFFKAKIFEP